jgi:hypothetical protein
VATRDSSVVVVDMQVVSGSSELDKRKVDKYKECPGLSLLVAERCGVVASSVSYTSGTLSRRGEWSSRSHSTLIAMGVAKTTLAGLTTRCLQGSHTNFERFMKTTAFRPDPG